MKASFNIISWCDTLACFYCTVFSFYLLRGHFVYVRLHNDM